MKRLLLLFVGLLFAIPTFAQIELGTKEAPFKRVANIRSGFINIYHQVDNGYFLALRSTNEFEDWLWIKIGVTLDEALQSARSFETLYDGLEKDASIDFKDEDGDKFVITRDVIALTPSLVFSKVGESRAGIYIYYISDCRAVIRRLEKMQ